MTIGNSARRMIRKFGLDVSRFPRGHHVFERERWMRENGVTLVLDVGAHVGHFGMDLRRHGYRGRICSFEPLTGPFERLAARAAADSRWQVYQLALGADHREIEMNVAANEGQSSSVLQMLPAHRAIAPHASYVGTTHVQQWTLDELRDELVDRADRLYLKADVQGYEPQVLDGASLLMRNVVALELEVSFVQLYAGAPSWNDIMMRVADLDMGIMDLKPAVLHPDSGEWLQADVVFARR